MGAARGTPKERLKRLSRWNHVNGCIEFRGYRTIDGYGMMRDVDKARLAHRVAYEIYNEKIPESMEVLHSCDNPSCVNPMHLRLGTHDDNMKDMVAKGRGRGKPGIKHHFAKLNPEKAFEIRWHCASGRRHKDVATEYGVTRSLIGMIARCEIWKPEIHD